MKTIYEDAKDLNVRKYVAYAKKADKKLYTDENMTVQATKTEVEDAFKKGMLLIIDTTNILMPVAMAGTAVKTIDDSGSTLATASWAVASA